MKKKTEPIQISVCLCDDEMLKVAVIACAQCALKHSSVRNWIVYAMSVQLWSKAHKTVTDAARESRSHLEEKKGKKKT